MANLKEIRTRITSVSSTKKITSAMKMVSAARLRKAQDAVTQIKPYSNKLSELLKDLSMALDDKNDNPYAKKREIEKVLLVIVSSNRGLCGAFNSNIVKKTIELVNTKYKKQFENQNVDFFIFGKKGEEILSAKSYKKNIVNSNHKIFDKINFEKIIPDANFLMSSFIEEKYDKIDIIYNSFKNAASQIIKNENFLPISIELKNKTINNDYIFEPNEEDIMKILVPKSLKIQIYKSLLDSIASEHGARMTAMHKATDNATEMIKQLKLNYNKARQSIITNEIIEIVSGAEALNN